MRSFILGAILCTAAFSVRSQVPIDLSKAREFRVIWKVSLGGDIFPIHFVPDVCGYDGLSVLTGGLVRGRFTWRTEPLIDTTNIDRTLGILPHPIDYDGVEPMEYVNTRGHILACRQGSDSPFPLTALDTVAGCAGTPQAVGDVDDDGYADVVCNIGGGGYTARVIRGGPNAGRGCQRTFHVPRVSNRDQFNSTEAFWRSSSGEWRLLQYEKDSMALSPWLVLYEMRSTKTPEGMSFTFVKTDSLYGNGIHIGDMPIGDAAVVTDTATDTDWLLVMHRLNDGPRTWVLERFDATAGRFTPTGERVTGVDFYEPWIAGYSLGTAKPVIMLGEGSFCYADQLEKPFARLRVKGTGLQPVSGLVAINDQTGDGIPDLVISGGQAMIAVYTLDSSAISSMENDSQAVSAATRLDGMTLYLWTAVGGRLTIRLVTTDGQSYAVAAPDSVQPGEQRIDLASHLQALPIGVYLLHVQVGDNAHVLRYVR